jgi:hypothetical protein
MVWNKISDGLPEIPKGKHGISIMLACFDPCYDEINPRKGYFVNHFASFYIREDGTPEFTELVGDEFTEVCETITHWCYYPDPPEYDPDILNPIFKHYHETSRPQGKLKQI